MCDIRRLNKEREAPSSKWDLPFFHLNFYLMNRPEMIFPFFMIVKVYTPPESRDTFNLLLAFRVWSTSLPEKSYTFIKAPVRSSALWNRNSFNTGLG